MAYYAMLIEQRTELLMDFVRGLLMVLSGGQFDPCTNKGQFIPVSRNVMA